MTYGDARLEVIRALAEKKRRDPQELEAEMLAAGPECPFDSIWLVKAGVRAARRMGFKLKPRKADAPAFKSVDALARHLQRLAQEREAA